MPADAAIVTAAEVGLPSWYDAVPVHVCQEPLSSDVELARWLAGREAALGYRPTTVFVNLTDRPGAQVLGNPYPRAVLLASMRVPEPPLAELAARLAGPTDAVVTTPAWPWRRIDSLHELPVLRHRPGDAGRYITAGVVASRPPDGGPVNLGVYRIQVAGPHRGHIFLNPRSDGHRNLRRWLERDTPMPVTVALGAEPAYILAAASRLPADGDDLDVVARLLGRPAVTVGDPPAPVNAGQVVTGLVTGENAWEGPFGEFKGYYAEARMSSVLEVTAVWERPGTAYPAIVAGAESGLTLMSLQNEYLMYAHLRAEGFAVHDVRYPVAARGEFVALIAAERPDKHLLAEAMRFDQHAKIVICADRLARIGDAIANHGLSAQSEPYRRKSTGRVEGERVGIVLDLPPSGRRVEF